MEPKCENCKFGVHYTEDNLKKADDQINQLMQQEFPFSKFGHIMADLADMKNTCKCHRYPDTKIVYKDHWCGEHWFKDSII